MTTTCSDQGGREAAAREGRRLLPVPFALYPANDIARQTAERLKREAYEVHRKSYTAMNAERQLRIKGTLKVAEKPDSDLI